MAWFIFQAQCLAGLLTHTQLPGLASLDQMHLLALADTVASCNVDFADRFDINKAKEAMAKEIYSRSEADEPSMGRFLSRSLAITGYARDKFRVFLAITG